MSTKEHGFQLDRKMIVNAPSTYGYGVAGPLSEQLLELLIREYEVPITFPETSTIGINRISEAPISMPTKQI